MPSQFLVKSAMDKECNDIDRTETLQLSTNSAKALVSALENPPKVNAKLLRAAQHYKGTVNATAH